VVIPRHIARSTWQVPWPPDSRIRAILSGSVSVSTSSTAAQAALAAQIADPLHIPVAEAYADQPFGLRE
jgi:hypothetical protein